MSKNNPPLPGKPGSDTPPLEEPTEPTGPLPPKDDQRAPELRTATATPLAGPPTARGQQGEYLTTAQGARLYDTDHSLKAGERGPTLLQDHHLREKITHFDHDRIPEHDRAPGRGGRTPMIGGRGIGPLLPLPAISQRGRPPLPLTHDRLLGACAEAV